MCLSAKHYLQHKIEEVEKGGTYGEEDGVHIINARCWSRRRFFPEKNLALSCSFSLDVLVSSDLTNQKRLFDAATNFAYENKGLLVKTESWKELMKTNPKLASKIMIIMLQLE